MGPRTDGRIADDNIFKKLARDVGVVVPGSGPPPPDMATLRERSELADLLQEVVARQKEALRLYAPSPVQAPFHGSLAIYRLIRGGNRAGKTLAAGVEYARALTRQDPFHKYPDTGRAIAVGKDLLDISKVVYRKLFKPGAIKILRDSITQKWRTYDPRCDLERESEAVDAPPLIAERFYNSRLISWENKKEEIPRTIRLRTGWELTFFSGQADPPKGWDIDLAWFDEEIPVPTWFTEMIPRLVDRRGRMIWSATAEVGSPKLFELSQEAEKLKAHGELNPRVEEFEMTIFTNTYMSEQQQLDFAADIKALGDEEAYETKVLGKFAIHGRRIYPEFSERGPHHIDAFPVPENWTRYAIIDPGRQVCGGLFIAVPEPHDQRSDRPVVYDEMYIRKCNAMKFAEVTKGKVGEAHVHTWLIDHHEGRKIETGSGLSIEEQYHDELIKIGCAANGFHGFAWANGDMDAGIEAAKRKLQLRSGRPDWLWMTEKLPWFLWEIKRYMDKRESSGIIADRPLGGQDHLMDCFRYGAMHPLRYVKPPAKSHLKKGWTTKYIEAKKKRDKAEEGWGESIKLG